MGIFGQESCLFVRTRKNTPALVPIQSGNTERVNRPARMVSRAASPIRRTGWIESHRCRFLLRCACSRSSWNGLASASRPSGRARSGLYRWLFYSVGHTTKHPIVQADRDRGRVKRLTLIALIVATGSVHGQRSGLVHSSLAEGQTQRVPHRGEASAFGHGHGRSIRTHAAASMPICSRSSPHAGVRLVTTFPRRTWGPHAQEHLLLGKATRDAVASRNR